MTGEPLGSPDQGMPVRGHVCLFHDGYEELCVRIGAFIRPALTDPRQGVVLAGPPGVAQRLRRELELIVGISLEDGPIGQRVLIVESERDPDGYIERIRGAIDALTAEGMEVVRAVGRVVWNAPDFPLPEDHLWLESRLTAVVAGRRAVLVCAYDVSELPGAALMYGGLETHPRVMLGDRLSESPRYMEPDRYLTTRLLDLDWLTPQPRTAT